MPYIRTTAALFLALLVPLHVSGAQQDLTPATTHPSTGQPPVAEGRLRTALTSLALEYDRLHFDSAPDGTLWVRAATYKASFAGAGATYVPSLGPLAPRNYPVTFSLESITVAGIALPFEREAQVSRAGARVALERGSLTELYATRSDSMEQMFRFESLPGPGDLVIRIAVHSELSVSGGTEGTGGFTFSNELGSVRYGRAVAVDHRGYTSAAPARWHDGAIEIRVPADVVAEAAFPLTVDPVISTFSIDHAVPADNRFPDVAYDPVMDRHCVVWQRNFSSVDTEIYSVLIDSSDNPVPDSGRILSPAFENWHHPRIAYNRDAAQFLIVAESGQSPDRTIVGRAREGLNSLGAPFEISSPNYPGDKLNPDVGGDPDPDAPSYYCVVWERVWNSADHDIHARLVRTDGSLVGTDPIFVDDSIQTLDEAPSIARSCGMPPDATQTWTIVWQRAQTPTDHDIWGSQLRWDGALVAPTFSIYTGGFDARSPSVSTILDGATGARPYLVAWQVTSGGFERIGARVMRGISPVAPPGGSYVLGTGGADQFDPSVDSDGSSFVVGFAQKNGAFPFLDHDIYVASYCLSDASLIETEFPQLFAGSAFVSRGVQIAAHRSSEGSPQEFFGVWTTGDAFFEGHTTGGRYRTPGLGYDYCQGGLNSSGSRAMLRAHGSISIADNSMVLEARFCPPNKPGLFFLGTTQLSVPFGEGLRCVGGQTWRIQPIAASDASGVARRALDFGRSYGAGVLSGAPGVNYQYWYRDPQGGPVGFNLSNGLHVEHAP